MADMDYDDFGRSYDQGGARPRQVGRLVHLAGAACSVALLIGLGAWGYKLAVRDVTGIPVIRAIEGPLRMAPAVAGGDVAANQGLSVNAIAAAGTAMPLPETLVLAPQSIGLSDEDVAGLAVSASSSLQDAVADEEMTVSQEILSDGALEPLTLDAASLDIADETQPMTEADAVAAALAVALSDETTDTDVSAEPAVQRSTRPMARPANLTSGDQTANVELAAVTSIGAVDGATVAAGTQLVQFGAFEDDATAQAEWDNLQSRFVELLSGKSPVVQTAQSGGKTFYRLRATGFADQDDARRFCAALLAESASCVPVLQR